ncbi:MAG: TrbI/VirB10 family protein, partial [Pseudomonadota bacterium]
APPQPVAPPVVVPPPPPVIEAKSAPTNEKVQARMKSAMLTGGGSAAPANVKNKSNYVGNDPNSSFAQSVEESKSETIEATQVKNLNRTIIQGKFIHGVLETAIDSTLPGPIRAITSHDTYAESGRSVLIPKGSRLIGTYNANIRKGQARVYIIWTRVVRPDGVDVAINSPGVDSLGRVGMGGDVDNKYFEAFSTAILSSSLDIGIAAVGEALFGNQQQTTTTTAGGTTTVSSPSATAMQTAVQTVGEVGKTIAASTLSIMPTIHVDQGQEINIFVNKDVVFPYGIGGGTGFIP